MKKIIALLVFLFLTAPMARGGQSVGGGDLVFKPDDPKVGEVLFSHERHVAGSHLQCSNCHYTIFQMAKGSYKMNMDRITKGEFCGTCHDGRKAFDVKDKKNCKRCHR